MASTLGELGRTTLVSNKLGCAAACLALIVFACEGGKRPSSPSSTVPASECQELGLFLTTPNIKSYEEQLD